MITVKVFMEKTNAPLGSLIAKASETLTARDKDFIIIGVSFRFTESNTPTE